MLPVPRFASELAPPHPAPPGPHTLGVFSSFPQLLPCEGCDRYVKRKKRRNFCPATNRGVRSYDANALHWYLPWLCIFMQHTRAPLHLADDVNDRLCC